MKIKIITNDFQHRAFLNTMQMFNQICNEISEIAFKKKEYRPFHLHKIVYRDLKNKYNNYSSQLIIRSINCVSLSYKLKGERRQKPTGFKTSSVVVYDLRVLSFENETISIWTTEGRLKNIPIVVHDKELFKYRKGQTDLKYENGKWFLLCCVESPEQPKSVTKECLGVDLGIKQIATTSDGDSYSGTQIKEKRKQYHDHRQRLQKRRTRSAKRRIKTIGKKESRFRKDINHQISKKLVEKAKGTNCALVLEELKGINNRVTVRKSTRNERMSWSFYQLRTFITYKALEQGVNVIVVPSAYTSQTCSNCGHCEKKNRKNQSAFVCLSCGFSTNADYNASLNIKTLGDQSMSLLLGSNGA